VDREVQQRHEICERQRRQQPQQRDADRSLVQVDDEERQQQTQVQIDPDLPPPVQLRDPRDAVEQILPRAAVGRVGEESEERGPDDELDRSERRVRRDQPGVPSK
jgi:hypothetical protein